MHWRSQFFSKEVFILICHAILFGFTAFLVVRGCHLFGHLLGGWITGCHWIGFTWAAGDHGAVYLSFPTIIYEGTHPALLYWNGGFIFVALLMIGNTLFPYPNTFFAQYSVRLFGMYLSVVGMVLPAWESFLEGDIFSTSDILNIPSIILLGVLWGGAFLLLFIYAGGIIHLVGRSLPLRFFEKALFLCLIWTLPMGLWAGVFFLAQGMTVVPILLTICALSPPLLAPFFPQGTEVWLAPLWGRHLYKMGLITLVVVLMYLAQARWQFWKPSPWVWSKPGISNNLPLSWKGQS